MDISNIISKPDIGFTVEHVNLAAPESAQIPSDPGYVNVEDDVQDVVDSVSDELAILNEYRDLLVSSLPQYEIPIPAEYDGVLAGKTSITMSDYLQSMSGETYGAVAIRDIYEAHMCENDPSGLAVPFLDSVIEELKSDLTTLTNGLFSGYGLGDPSMNQLFLIKSNISDAKRFRDELCGTASIAKSAIDKALWLGVLNGCDWQNAQSKIRTIIESLRSIKSLLKIATGLYSADWGSVATSLRDKIQNKIVDEYLNQVVSLYSQAYNKVVAPAREILNILQAPALADVEEASALSSMLTLPMSHVAKTFSDTVVDIYAIRRKRTELRVNGARSISSMVYVWKLTSQLDSIIRALETVSNSGTGSSLANDFRFPLAPEAAISRLLESKETEAAHVLQDIIPLDPDRKYEGPANPMIDVKLAQNTFIA